MSIPQHPLPIPHEDIWEEKAGIIRQLYLCERKTLKQVKEILESEHGFPIHTLSRHETMIRDKLGLRKKLKRTDWPVVYRHYRNRAGKETGIYLNDMRIPWNNAWKEIRRNGDRSMRNGQLNPLPEGVVVRTPSPISSPILSDFQGPHSSITLVSSPPPPASFMVQDNTLNIEIEAHPNMSYPPAVHTHSSLNDFALIPYTSQADNRGSIMAGIPNSEVSLYRTFLQTIPWNQFKTKMISIVDYNAQPSEISRPAIDHFLGQDIPVEFSWFIPDSLLCHPISSAVASLPQLDGRSTAPALNFNTYHFFGKFLYLLSNKLLTEDTPTANSNASQIFDIIFVRLPTEPLMKLFDIALPTMRATWEASVLVAWRIHHTCAFCFLMKAGIQHHDWVIADGHKYLSYAVSMDCIDIVRELLRVRVRADDSFNGAQPDETMPLPAILESVITGNYDCAKELMKWCDVNRIICPWPPGPQLFTSPCRSNFAIFISVMYGKSVFHYARPSPQHGTGLFSNVKARLNIETYNLVLDMFLDSGANADLLWRQEPHLDISCLYDANDIPVEWKPSLLDHCFYQDIELFNRIRRKSKNPEKETTRSGICLSAKRGKEFLQAYLDSQPVQHPSDRKKLLELILAEQFLMQGPRRIDLEVIRGLIEFGVDIHVSQLKTELTDRELLPPQFGFWDCRRSSVLLCLLVYKSCSDSFTQDISDMITFMVSAGATIDSFVVAAAVTPSGLGRLPELASQGVDIRAQGSFAFCRAAHWDNFEALSWLLQAGVDINAEVNKAPWETPCSIIAYLYQYRSSPFHNDHKFFLGGYRRCAVVSWKMLKYLISCGAKLRVNSQDTSGFQFLKTIIQRASYNVDSVSRLEFFLSFASIPEDLATTQETLLESCAGIPRLINARGNTAIFDNYDHHRLAVYELLLNRGCPVLRGAGLGFYIFWGGQHEVIYKILDAGADINACLGLHPYYPSPLQAASMRGDLELVIQLRQRGAAINQPALGRYGRTALQAACEWRALSMEDRARQIKLVRYLISQGADVNAPAAADSGMTALQIAALYGDMEVALLLLEHGAITNAPPARDAGYCALDAAAFAGRLDMVKLLLNIGAHSHHREQNGYEGAIKLAIDNGHFAVADLIREHIKLLGNCIIVPNLNDD